MQTATHIFETAGLGKAPYKYIGCIKLSSGCQYCGTGILYQFWLLSSDGKKFYVGSDCIEKSGDSGLMYHAKKERSKISREQRLARQQAQYEARQAERRSQAETRLAQYFADHASSAHIFEWAKNSSGIPLDMYNNLAKWGSMSDKQLDFLTRLYEESLVAKVPCPTGKVTIEGVILSFKSSYSQYGTITKMLVESDQGYRVYGTLPKSIDDVEKGNKVRFVATVEKSPTDDNFGFFNRPTQATILS